MPEESQRVVETRLRVMGRARAARSAQEALAQRLTAIWSSDPRLSVQGRQEEAERVVGQKRPAIEEELAGARRDTEFVLRQTEQQLAELRNVSPEVLATRAAVLSPVLNVAMENPGALLNTYRRRFSDRTDRRLLEESAQIVIDGLAGSDGGAFEQQWRNLQDELSMQRSPEERQALADRAALQELTDYVSNVQRIVQAHLDSLLSGGMPADVEISLQFSVAEINRYESEHDDSSDW